jgi:hypothetical protein
MFWKAIAKWYSEADPETIDLCKRFAARLMSQKNGNEYIKQILRRELDNIVEAPSADNAT